MTEGEAHAVLQDLLRSIFERNDIQIRPETTAADISGWDSIRHIEIMLAVEQEFGIKFRSSELDKIKSVGELISTIRKKSS